LDHLSKNSGKNEKEKAEASLSLKDKKKMEIILNFFFPRIYLKKRKVLVE